MDVISKERKSQILQLLSDIEQEHNITIIHAVESGSRAWDIGKCLRLLYKGNAVLQEWLNSPVVYRSDESKHKLLRDFAAEVFNPVAAFYHYYSQVKKRLAEDKTRTNAKAFLYGFRSLLCARWIAEKNSVPPVLFEELVREYLSDEEKQVLDTVLEQKAAGGEKDDYQVPEKLWSAKVETFGKLKGAEVKSNSYGGSQEFDFVLRRLVM